MLNYLTHIEIKKSNMVKKIHNIRKIIVNNVNNVIHPSITLLLVIISNTIHVYIKRILVLIWIIVNNKIGNIIKKYENNCRRKYLIESSICNIIMSMKLKYYATVSEYHDEIVKSNINELCNSNQCMNTYTFNNQVSNINNTNNTNNGWSRNKNILRGSRISWVFILICVMACNILLVKADPMCDIIAATNIQSISGYSQWSCTTGGFTSTAPCTSPVWNGLVCTGNNVVSITLNNFGLTGILNIYKKCL